VIDKIELNYEGKRDRWNGYNANDYSQVVEEYERQNELIKLNKGKELEEKLKRK
jgi:pre-mRNA-processing factor SLU7